MEIHFSSELEAKLAQFAAQQGRNADEVVMDAVGRYFDEGLRFTDAERNYQAGLIRGEGSTHKQTAQSNADYARSAAIERLRTFGKAHGLSLGGTSLRKMRDEARP